MPIESAHDVPPTPYDPLLVSHIRDIVRLTGRLPLTGPRLALQAVAAAFFELRRRGWHCSLHLGGAPHATYARLDLWGAPVADHGERPSKLRCAGRAGGTLKSVPPRIPVTLPSTVARVAAGDDVADNIRHLLDQLGGLPQMIAPGENVLLKANFNSYHAPPASTSFDLLTAVVDELRRVGAAQIALGECSAIVLGRTRGVLKRSGLVDWAEAANVQLRYFDEEAWRRTEIPGRHFSEIVTPACLEEFDRIIYLLCTKTHQMAGVSLGLKMAIGFMHPAQRLELHHDHLIERIADASLAVRPDLAILDARTCFITGGPAVGTIASPGILLAARELEALEQQALDLLAEHGAAGVDIGRGQLERVREIKI